MVNSFNLDSAFTLGIEEIDSEHIKLVEMLNRVNDLLGEGKSKWARIYFNNILSLYVDEHFANEERFMESFEFPSLEGHKKIHSNFRKKFEKQKTLVETCDDASFRKILSDTFIWVSAHIGRVDKKYIEYYLNKKASELH